MVVRVGTETIKIENQEEGEGILRFWDVIFWKEMKVSRWRNPNTAIWGFFGCFKENKDFFYFFSLKKKISSFAMCDFSG